MKRRGTKVNFINLSNGVHAIEKYGLTDWRYIRIQSTWCEQQRWQDILWTLSDDFLVAAAKGEHCCIYDFSEKRVVTRAVWQGLEWVKFVLWKRWYRQTYTPVGRAKTAGKYFEGEYNKLPKKVKNRIDYYGKFAKCGYILIDSVTDKLQPVSTDCQARSCS